MEEEKQKEMEVEGEGEKSRRAAGKLKNKTGVAVLAKEVGFQ